MDSIWRLICTTTGENLHVNYVHFLNDDESRRIYDVFRIGVLCLLFAAAVCGRMTARLVLSVSPPPSVLVHIKVCSFFACVWKDPTLIDE